MKTFTLVYDTPMWILDKIIDNVYDEGYPNTNSIIGDILRGDISTAYGINLNMFDTHKCNFATFNGSFLSGEYFIYEGSAEKIKEIFKDKSYADYICGTYPIDRKVLGFFSTEFRDPEYRKAHMDEYFKFIYNAAIVFIDKKIRDYSGYNWYIDLFPLLYTFRRMHKDGVPIRTLSNINITYDNRWEYDIAYHGLFVYTIFNNYDKFIEVISKNSWSEAYKFFRENCDGNEDIFSAIYPGYDSEICDKLGIGTPKEDKED